MSINKSRLNRIERQMRVRKHSGYDQHALIEGWRYNLIENYSDANMYVFVHEWVKYCARELEKAKNDGTYSQIKNELEALGSKIDSANGFMEIVRSADAESVLQQGYTPTTK